MDESLQALEKRLEQLVPKGLSDQGREQMEERIDEWAAAVDDGTSHGAWKWGLGAAAAVSVLLAVDWGGRGEQPPLVGGPGSVQGIEATAAADFLADGDEELAALLTLSRSRSVQARTDRGWVQASAETPHRYWSYEITEEEELMDEESGYAVRVLSQHEEWVPVAVTQL